MHVCLFDIDGTLLNAHGAGRVAMEQTLAELFDRSKPVKGIPTAGRTDRAITRDLFEFHGIPDTPRNRDRLYDGYADRLADSMHRHDSVLLPGVLNLLQELQNRDHVQLGLLTGNFERGAWIKLRHFELDRFFAFGGFGDHFSDRNDVARSVRTLLQDDHPRSGPDPQLWVIGDTPADVVCGRAIGAHCVAVATGSVARHDLAQADPDLLFDDFSDPDALLLRIDATARSI